METKADDDRFSQGDEKAASLKGRCHVADCTGILPLKHRPDGDHLSGGRTVHAHQTWQPSSWICSN